jgi:glycosyltransferase involved in cell wall biosynthesis
MDDSKGETMAHQIRLTVIIPAFNEAKGLHLVLDSIIPPCRERNWPIIVVNDGSSDDTTDILRQYEEDVKIITNSTNLGYGASIKRGIKVADTEWVATFDADGQHRVEDLIKLSEKVEHQDAVFGKRESNSHYSVSRLPGKWVLGKIADILVGQKIPDINCGLRVYNRNAMKNIMLLASDGFSFSTSSLIAFMKLGYKIRFVPITTRQRIGNSTVNQFKDGFNVILLILRLITLFDPLRIMLPFAFFFFCVGIVYQLFSFITYGLFFLFAFVEIFGFYYAVKTGVDFSVALDVLWDGETQIIWASVVSFWFGTQAFKSK